MAVAPGRRDSAGSPDCEPCRGKPWHRRIARCELPRGRIPHPFHQHLSAGHRCGYGSLRVRRSGLAHSARRDVASASGSHCVESHRSPGPHPRPAPPRPCTSRPPLQHLCPRHAPLTAARRSLGTVVLGTQFRGSHHYHCSRRAQPGAQRRPLRRDAHRWHARTLCSVGDLQLVLAACAPIGDAAQPRPSRRARRRAQILAHLNHRHPRLRLAVHAAHRAPHPRVQRLLRRAALHRAAREDPRAQPQGHHPLRRPVLASTTPTPPAADPAILDPASRSSASATACSSSRTTSAARSSPPPRASTATPRSTVLDPELLFHGLPASSTSGCPTATTPRRLPPASPLRPDLQRRRRHRQRKRRIWAVQFHPEVAHTRQGMELLKNFASTSATPSPTGPPSTSSRPPVARIRAQVGNGHAICGLSGGVDSSVAAVLVAKRHRRPPHLHLRQQRRPPQRRVLQGPEDHARAARPQRRRRRRRRALPRISSPASPTPNQAQDHRQRVHRGLRRRGQEDLRSRKVHPARRGRLARPGHPLPRRHRILQRPRPFAHHQEPPQRRRPARGHEAQAHRAPPRPLQG
jgi:hypothetical protein